MSDLVVIEVNGRPVSVAPGTSVAAALLNAGEEVFRASARGAPRGPLCAMGICYECRVAIDGVEHQRACLEPVRAGLRVITGG